MTQQPPAIGISGAESDSSSVRAMMTQIRDAGAIPVFLGNHAMRNPAQDIHKIDALVVMGSDSDIDPARYGQTRHAATRIDEGPQAQARERYEDQMLALALSSKMPVMGVCAGMQRLNVLLGGSLHQHVPDLIGDGHHAQQEAGIAPYIPVQGIYFDPDSQLSRIAQGHVTHYLPAHGVNPQINAVLENSMHHQVVDRLGAGLKAAAFSDDPIRLADGRTGLLTEAIEADPAGGLKDQYVLGVQWHPEFGASPLGKRLADEITTQADRYAKANGRSHLLSESIQENMRSQMPAPGVNVQQAIGFGRSIRG